jgi:hypothetical protein
MSDHWRVPPSEWHPTRRSHKKDNLLKQEKYMLRAEEYIASLTPPEVEALRLTLLGGDASPLDAAMKPSDVINLQPIGIFRRMKDDFLAWWTEITS